MKPILALLPAILLLSTAASRPQAPVEPAGEPVNCINTGNIRESKVRDDNTVDFVMTNGVTYRNTLPNRCPGLGMSQAFAYSPTASRLCNVDIITVIEQGGGPRRGAACGLGQFQPVKPAPPPAPAG